MRFSVGAGVERGHAAPRQPKIASSGASIAPLSAARVAPSLGRPCADPDTPAFARLAEPVAEPFLHHRAAARGGDEGQPRARDRGDAAGEFGQDDDLARLVRPPRDVDLAGVQASSTEGALAKARACVEVLDAYGSCDPDWLSSLIRSTLLDVIAT